MKTLKPVPVLIKASLLLLLSSGKLMAVIPTPTITASGSSTICSGTSLTLTANSGTGYTYQWQLNGGNIASATSITFAAATSGTYAVVVTSGTDVATSNSITVVVNASPTTAVTGNTAICSGSTTVLDAGAGFTSYAWSTGASSRTITAFVAAVYNVTVTNASGCTGTAAATTGTVALPTPTISGTGTFCATGSTTLAANAGYASYLWSTGATASIISINTQAVYGVTVTNASGCPGSTSKTSTAIAVPVPTITGNMSVCVGGSTTLSVSPAYPTYSWSTGATTQTLSVNTATVLNVTATNSNGCQGSASATTAIVPLPTPNISGSTTLCAGGSGSTTLTANAGYTAYLWSNGANTQTTSVSNGAVYNVTVTNSNGCQAVASVTTTTVAPTPTITGNTAICSGSSTALSANGGYASYAWSTGATTQSISAFTAAVYNVTVTDANGCQGSTSISTSTVALPAPTIAGSATFCAGGSTTLTANAGFSTYAWSSGVTTSSAVISNSGVNTVTVTNSNGCQNTASLTTTAVALPTPSITGNTAVCSGGSTTLSAGAGYASYVWSTGATTSTISVVTATSVNVNVTNSAGCHGTVSVVTSVAPLPTPNISGSTTLCAGGSTTLTANAGYTAYAWSNGANTQTASVSNAGVVSVTVTNSNGCQGVASATTTTTAPTPSITGNTTICAGGTTTLTASPGYTAYTWSTGLTTQSITASSPAVYNVTVTNSSGCQGSASISTSTVSLPVPSISGTSTFCAGGSTTLTANAGFTAYAWSTGATTQSVAVNTTTTLSVTVTNSNGCQGVASASTTVISLPTPAITGNTLICSGSTSTLSAGAGYSSYLWSTGAVTSTVAVITATALNVDVTNSSGCHGTTSVVTSVAALPTPSISGTTTFCAGGSTTLTANPGYSTYVWSTGTITPSISLTSPGVITLTVTNNNGCQGVTTVTTSTIALPVPAISGNTAICAGNSNTLTANPGFASYAWSTGATTPSITVSTPSTLTLTVTNASGCQGVTTATTNTVALPTPTISGNAAICAGNTTTLSLTGYSSYLWSTGSTASSVTANSGNTFSVVVTNSNGCQGSASITTTIIALPTPTISGNTAICSGGSTTLTANAGYSTYAWSTSATTPSISVSTPAVFNLTVTNSNGCVGVGSVTTTTLSTPVPTIAGSATFCAGGSTTLSAGAGYTAYAWSTGATTQSITVSSVGPISLTVTNASGCQGVTTITTSTVALPTPSISGSTVICAGSSTTLTANSGYSSYLWSNGATTSSISPTVGGVYNVTVTGTSGCQGNTSVSTATAALPTPSVSGSLTFCAGATTTLTANAGYSAYLWTGGATTQSLGVTTPGPYTVTVTNSNGCQGTTSVNTSTIVSPSPTITGTSTFCAGNTTTLNAGAGFTSYSWSTGPSTPTISTGAAAVINVTVTGANGCQGVGSVTTTTLALPAPSISGGTAICVGNTNTLTASAGFTAYAWSTGSTASSITVSAPATINLTVTNSSGCQGVTSVTTNTVALPTPTVTGTFTFCSNASTTLNAGAGFSTYSWSPGGATTRTITTGLASVFNVTVTNASGCQGVASATTTTLVAPTPSITGTASFCAGSTTTLNAGAGYSGYLWSTGSTSQSITPSTAAVFAVTVTAANACQGSTSVATSTLALPVPSITGNTLICAGNINTLTATAGFPTYTWSTGSAIQTATVNAPAAVTVTVTNSNGCKGVATVNTNTTALPAPVITGNFTFCSNASTTLNAGLGFSTYSWSTGAITRTIATTAGAVFNVTVTNSNGCQGVASATTTTLSAPVPTITGATTLCAGGSTSLDAGAGYTGYAWSTGSSSQIVTVSNAAAYNVTVTSANGCQGNTSVSTTTLALPVPAISGQTAICIGNTNTLSATGGYSAYAWTTGATTQSIGVNTPSSLTVTVTDANGCQGIATASTNTVALPVPAISGPTAICAGSTATLNAGAGYTAYAWSTSASTRTITASAAGLYSVVVTTSLGCQGSASLTIITNTLPTPVITGDGTLCAGGLSNLGAGAGYSAYAWSTGATTQSVNATTAAVYNVTVTNSNGCKGTAALTATVYALPVPAISGPTAMCTGNSTTLTTGPSYSTYLWSNGDATATTVINTAGVVSLSVTSSHGCLGVKSVTTVINPLPVPVITGNTVVCAGYSSTLNAGSGYLGYLWSTGSNNQSIITNTSGVITVTVTSLAGCSASTSISTSVNATPTPVITGTNEFCAGSHVVLTASPGFTNYLWSNAASTQTVNVSSGGTVYVTVVDNSGCQGTGSFVAIMHPIPAPPVISVIGNTFSSTYAAGNQWYMNNNAVPGATLQTYESTATGQYAASVTEFGCTSGLSTVLFHAYVGLEEISNNASLSIYPNPAKDLITIEGDVVNRDGFEISLYDLQGKLVMSTTNVKTLDVSGMTNGLYLLTAKKENSDLVIYRKIVIMH